MSYDSWKEDVSELDEEPAQRCPICTGHDDAEPCTEECAHLVDVLASEASIARLYEFCRRAIGLARQYLEEERRIGRPSRRLETVMQQVAVWREDIRLTRTVQRRKAAA